MTMMAITNNNQIGTVVPLGLNTYFLHEDGDPDEKLRPDWTSKFVENAGWHAWAVRFLRTKCHQLHAPYKKEDMAGRTDDELTKKLGNIFRRLQKLYASSKSTAESELAKGKVKQWARRHQRKVKVGFLAVFCKNFRLNRYTESRKSKRHTSRVRFGRWPMGFHLRSHLPVLR